MEGEFGLEVHINYLQPKRSAAREACHFFHLHAGACACCWRRNPSANTRSTSSSTFAPRRVSSTNLPLTYTRGKTIRERPTRYRTRARAIYTHPDWRHCKRFRQLALFRSRHTHKAPHSPDGTVRTIYAIGKSTHMHERRQTRSCYTGMPHYPQSLIIHTSIPNFPIPERRARHVAIFDYLPSRHTALSPASYHTLATRALDSRPSAKMRTRAASACAALAALCELLSGTAPSCAEHH